MCHFVTMTLEDSIPKSSVLEILNSQDFGMDEIDSSDNRHFVHENEHYFQPSSGACNCGTVLGSANAPDFDVDAFRSKEAIRLKRKGWGASKIDRAIEESLASRGSGAPTSKQKLERWTHLIERFLQMPDARYVGILLHEYSGHMSSRIDVLRKPVSPKELRSFLHSMDEDVLYEISTGPN